MPRKTSFCNGALLRSDAKRYWPLLFLYVTLWIFILPLQLVQVGRHSASEAILHADLHNTILYSVYGSVIMSLLFGCFMAMAVWSYLMTARTVGLMHALPVTRTQAFLSHALSGFGILTVGNALVFLLSVLCCAGRGFVDWEALASWLLLTELMELFFFALASLCAMITGWLLAIPVFYGAVNLAALLLFAVVSAMAQLFFFGYSGSEFPRAIRFLTPVMRIWESINANTTRWITVEGMDYQFPLEELSPEAFTVCGVYAAVGVALLLLVWYLNKKRPSESAGDAISFRWLRPVARWSIGLCGGLGLGLFLHYTTFYGSGLFSLLLCQIIMGVICFFAAQMLLQKKFRIFTKRWWVETAAMVAVLAAVVCCIRLDATGFQHRVPNADNVDSVRFRISAAELNTDDPAAVESVISLHRAILKQYDENGGDTFGGNTAYRDHLDSSGTDTYYVYMTYTLKNGAEMQRAFFTPVPSGSDIHRLLIQVVNRTDCREALMGLDVLRTYGGVNNVVGGHVTQYETGAFAELTRQQAQDLISHALSDAANSRKPIDPLRDTMYNSRDLDIEIRLNTDKGSVSFSLDVPDFAVETKAFLDALEFEEPVDGTYDSVEKCYDYEAYEDVYDDFGEVTGEVVYG